MRCKNCKKSFKVKTGKKCWNKYNTCMLCTVIAHPKEYPKNITLMVLAKAGKYSSPKYKIYAGKLRNGVYETK